MKGPRATREIMVRFLDEDVDRMPFSVRAVQIDGGSEFKGEFETACQQRGLRLFLLTPKSPKLNGCVERSHRMHEEEFHQCSGGDLTPGGPAARPARLRDLMEPYPSPSGSRLPHSCRILGCAAPTQRSRDGRDNAPVRLAFGMIIASVAHSLRRMM